MGIIYSVSCKQCKVTRNLDKFYTCRDSVQTRDDALEYMKEISEDSFRAGLLVSFMGEHMDHECVLFSETSPDSIEMELEPFYDENSYVEDFDFWDTGKG